MDTLKVLVLLWGLLAAASCGAGQKTSTKAAANKKEAVTQKFIEEVGDADEGDCYTKVHTPTGKQFLKTLCPSQLTDKLKKKIKKSLVGQGYSINAEEMASVELGADTLAALVDFQSKSGLHSGIIDESTLNKLGIQLP